MECQSGTVEPMSLALDCVTTSTGQIRLVFNHPLPFGPFLFHPLHHARWAQVTECAGSAIGAAIGLLVEECTGFALTACMVHGTSADRVKHLRQIQDLASP